MFATPDNSTIVISIKGTSTALIGSGGPTAKNDKLNDNMLFSCCCARVGFTWTPVCGCYAGSGKCDQNCLEASLTDESLFYPVGIVSWFRNLVTFRFSNFFARTYIIMCRICILILTFGSLVRLKFVGYSILLVIPLLPFRTFPRWCISLPTRRHLWSACRCIRSPWRKDGGRETSFTLPCDFFYLCLLMCNNHRYPQPSTQHVTHVYHTADPIPMGTCNGVFSPCAIGGFAFESR